ncbi:MAG: DUF1850 domain-containing protein [Desulfobacterales bacterium]|nr:DUF1850 domain-containing protein [Desulfobacterales bacterium]
MVKKLFLLCIPAGLFLLSGYPISCLTLRLPDQNNRLIFSAPLDPGEHFTLAYRHSVEKPRVEGIFQMADPPGILAMETRMTSVGTGLPNTFGERTRREGEWMVVDEGMVPLPPFRFFIATINRGKLLTPKAEFNLAALPQGTIVLVGAEQIPLARHLLSHP